MKNSPTSKNPEASGIHSSKSAGASLPPDQQRKMEREERGRWSWFLVGSYVAGAMLALGWGGLSGAVTKQAEESSARAVVELGGEQKEARPLGASQEETLFEAMDVESQFRRILQVCLGEMAGGALPLNHQVTWMRSIGRLSFEQAAALNRRVSEYFLAPAGEMEIVDRDKLLESRVLKSMDRLCCIRMASLDPQRMLQEGIAYKWPNGRSSPNAGWVGYALAEMLIHDPLDALQRYQSMYPGGVGGKGIMGEAQKVAQYFQEGFLGYSPLREMWRAGSVTPRLGEVLKDEKASKCLAGDFALQEFIRSEARAGESALGGQNEKAKQTDGADLTVLELIRRSVSKEAYLFFEEREGMGSLTLEEQCRIRMDVGLKLNGEERLRYYQWALSGQVNNEPHPAIAGGGEPPGVLPVSYLELLQTLPLAESEKRELMVRLAPLGAR